MAHKKSLETRRKILLSSIKLISEQGLERTTIRAIAHDANISVGLINYHFVSVDKIFREVIKFIFEELKPLVKDHAKRASGSPLANSLQMNVEIFSTHIHFYRCLLLSYFYSKIDPELEKIHCQNCQDFIDQCEKYLLEEFTAKKIKVSAEEVRQLATSIFCDLEGGLVLYHATRSNLLTEFSPDTRIQSLRQRAEIK